MKKKNIEYNKLLIVSNIKVVDKIKNFFKSILKIFKKEVKKETKPFVMLKTKKVEAINELQEKTISRPKHGDNKQYYKRIYNSINEGKCRFEDLSPSEILTVMKMQKVENEFILNKLQQAMDNY